MLAYRLLQLFLRLVVSVFFRNIEVVGKEKIPSSGGIIFAGNHPNSLMDPILVITHSGHIVHFAAKDVLFKSRFLRFFLSILGAIPVQRRQDHDGQIDNTSMFAALHKVLQQGGCMGIFPEGISHTQSELSGLKTGTARIALEATQNPDAPSLHIVPVGLTYLHRQRFRSQVLIHFGNPIPVDETWRAPFQEQPKETVRKLTEELERRLRSLTINAPDWYTLRFLHTVRRLYKPSGVHIDLETYAELMRRFSEGYQRASSDPEIQSLRQQVEAYQTRLEQIGIQDHDLRKNPHFFPLLMRFLGRIFYLLVLIPLSIPGAILHAPIGISAVVAGDYLTQRKDVVATTKLITAILFVPFLYLVLVFGVWWWTTPWIALGTAALLPLTGFATVRVLEKQVALRRSLQSLSKIIQFQHEIRELRVLRQKLVEALEGAVQRYHNPEVPRIFPQAGGD